VKVIKENTEKGVSVTFQVIEKPVLKKIIIEGERFIREKKIRDAIELKEGSFVDEFKVKESLNKIKDLYVKKGFTEAEINYKISTNDKNEANVKFIIDEKRPVKVRGMYIRGNKTIRSKRIMKLMKTRKAWLFNKGIFNKDVLNDDVKRIKDFYKSRGFSDVKVETDALAKKKGIYITVKIDEGKRYYIGKISITGNKDISLSELKDASNLNSGDIFSEQAMYEAASHIKGVYVDKGYIFSQIEPSSIFNLKTGKVDIIYKITENDVAYVENISIKGNVKTKDKVIRRELRIYPGDKFSGEKLRKSKQRLKNLGFFEDIRFDTEPGSKPNWVDLITDVKEAKTGYLSFGGGYSSIDDFIGFVELRQRNFDYKNWSTFTGAGQDLSITASFGTLTSTYELSFTNPWIFDKPVSFGFDIYRRGHDQEEDVGYGYQEKITGGDIRMGREFSDTLKGGIAYRFENVKISDVVDDATQELKDEKGSNNLSSIELTGSYDTRDNQFVPTKGIYFYNNFDITGSFLGGDKDFIKCFSRLSFYYPLIRKSVIEFRLRAGIEETFSDTVKVPIYKRFFAGGANSIRGYEERSIGPIDAVTNDPIGGEALFIGNAEYTYPLSDFLKLAAFFDTGNVWKKKSDFLSGSLYSSVGLGIRVKTPIGPVSVDYGWPLDIQPGKNSKTGRFHFNISRGF